jgi:hypothetical protein
MLETIFVLKLDISTISNEMQSLNIKDILKTEGV